MVIFSYNINGTRAAVKNGLKEFIKKTNADFFCLQETRADEETVNELVGDLDYCCHCSVGYRKGYSGVAILSKKEPIRKMDNFCSFDDEGRILALEFDNFILVSLYVPNGATRLEYKLLFLDKVLNELKTKLFPKKDVVVCTDFNISYTPLDLSNPQGCKDSTGYLLVEREKFSDYLNSGLVDSYRKIHPFTKRFTWSSYGAKKIGNASGNLYAFDYIFTYGKVTNKIINAGVLFDVNCSDHYPVYIEI